MLDAIGTLLAVVGRLAKQVGRAHYSLAIASALFAFFIQLFRPLFGARYLNRMPPEPKRRIARALIMPPNQWAVP